MSPSRGRKQFVPSRPRSEVITAVLVSLGSIAGTALLIWLMRPGKPGIPGGGGLMSRQPRVTILIILTGAAILAVVLIVTRRRRKTKLGAQKTIALGLVMVLLIATLGGIFWPGGVVRHWPKQPKFDQTPVTVPSSVPSTTSGAKVPGTTAKTGSTVTTPSTQTSPTTKAR
jgi:hypothetical protein